MPGPFRTCAFGASSKATHYSFKISLLLKIFLTALSKNPRSVRLVSKVAYLVKILLTGSNYKQKTICEVYIGIRHYEASFNQKKANRSTAFVGLCI